MRQLHLPKTIMTWLFTSLRQCLRGHINPESVSKSLSAGRHLRVTLKGHSVKVNRWERSLPCWPPPFPLLTSPSFLPSSLSPVFQQDYGSLLGTEIGCSSSLFTSQAGQMQGRWRRKERSELMMMKKNDVRDEGTKRKRETVREF